MVVNLDAKPVAFRLGGGSGRSASKSSSTRTLSFFSLPTGASSESELDSTGVIFVFFVDVGFLGDAAFYFGFSFFFFWLLFFVALSGLNLRLPFIHFLLLHPRTCVLLCCVQDASSFTINIPLLGIAHDPLNELLPLFDLLNENYIRVVVLLIHVHLLLLIAILA